MAADASLSLQRISQAMHAMFEMLSKPDVLPEFNALQVSSGLWPTLIAHLCIAELWSVEHTSRNPHAWSCIRMWAHSFKLLP